MSPGALSPGKEDGFIAVDTRAIASRNSAFSAKASGKAALCVYPTMRPTSPHARVGIRKQLLCFGYALIAQVFGHAASVLLFEDTAEPRLSYVELLCDGLERQGLRVMIVDDDLGLTRETALSSFACFGKPSPSAHRVAKGHCQNLVQLRPAEAVAARLMRPFGAEAFQCSHDLRCMRVHLLAREEVHQAILLVTDNPFISSKKAGDMQNVKERCRSPAFSS